MRHPNNSKTSFNFSQQGQTVAVFYYTDFYVGQVLQVHNPDFADVTLMTSTGKDNIFKWPQSEDTDQVAAKYVWFWLKLCPRTGHGKLTV